MDQVGQQLVEMMDAEPSGDLPAWCVSAPLQGDTRTFTPMESEGWDAPEESAAAEEREEEEEIFFVGPIRMARS